MSQAEDILTEAEKYYATDFEKGLFKDLKGQEKTAFLKNLLNNSHLTSLLASQNPTSGAKILDLGCGLGGFVATCEKNGFDVYGIELDKRALEITKLRLKNPQRAIFASGEDLPFENNFFDFVASSLVIEHVKNPELYIKEALRVVKPGGKFLLIAPNYLFPWEGHCQMLWAPWLLTFSKSLLKAYLKLKNKDTKELEGVNFKITPGYLKKIIRALDPAEINDLSVEIFRQKIRHPEKISYSRFTKVIKTIQQSKVLSRLLDLSIGFLRLTKLYHPVVLVVQK